jgi:VWFA-related protein
VLLASLSAQAQQPIFRTAVDVIAVDVQVVDGKGNPIDQLAAGAFQVSIEGQRRKVLSASFVGGDTSGRSVEPASPESLRGEAQSAGASRTFILAIDNESFKVGDARDHVETVRAFLDRLRPDDRVGLYVYPPGLWIPPSTGRAAIRARLNGVIGTHPVFRSYYNLKPSEIVDITTEPTNPHAFTTAARNRASTRDVATAIELDPVIRVQQRECPDDADCPSRIYAEGIGLAAELQYQVDVSLGGLERLLMKLAEIPGRKAVILLSGGLLVSDRLEGRPTAGDVARAMGQSAARANATVYTVHVETGIADGNTAAQRGWPGVSGGRDRALLDNWLDNFSRAAGGARFYVPSGGSSFAFERVLRESAGYYLLGVQPDEADRNGQPRELKVKVDRRGVTVRSRQWVVVPARR